MFKKFLPFENDFLSEHLDIKSLKTVQYFDATTINWVTHLRNSPPVIVCDGSVMHFKKHDVPVDRSLVIKNGLVRVVKVEGGSDIVSERENRWVLVCDFSPLIDDPYCLQDSLPNSQNTETVPGYSNAIAIGLDEYQTGGRSAMSPSQVPS